MGMNRKWNMKIFEYHDLNGESSTIKNPKLYIIDDDTESDNVMVEGLLHTQDSTTPQDPEPTPKDPEPTPKDAS